MGTRVSAQNWRSWQLPTQGPVADIAFDPWDRVWVAHGGVSVLIGDRVHSEFDFRYATALAIDTRGTAWAGGETAYGTGLGYLDVSTWPIEGDWQVVRGAPIEVGIWEIEADSAGNVWVGSIEPRYGHPQGLARFDGTAWESHTPFLVDSTETLYPPRLSASGSSGVWAVLPKYLSEELHYELRHWDGAEWSAPMSTTVGENNVPGWAVVDSGGLFVASAAGLLERVGDQWVVQDWLSNLRSPNTPLDIAGDSSRLWIATAAGLVLKAGEHLEVYDSRNSALPADRVTEVELDRHGNLWIGSWVHTAPRQVYLTVYNPAGIVGVSVEDVRPPDALVLDAYPNPFSESLRVEMPAGGAVVQVFDVLGRLVAAVEVDRQGVLHGSRLPPGPYLLQVQTPEGVAHRIVIKSPGG